MIMLKRIKKTNGFVCNVPRTCFRFLVCNDLSSTDTCLILNLTENLTNLFNQFNDFSLIKRKSLITSETVSIIT